MNERIRQLAEQAGMIVGDAGEFDMAKFMPKEVKFAELIVRECAGVADHSNVTGKSIIGQRIKEHFGVEDRAVPILSADEQALFAGITSSGLFTIEATKKAFGVEE